MATHLDLEEQEQLDQLKHFWKQYGNLISWLLIVVFGGFAAWNGYQYWQSSRAAQASALFDEVERAAQSGDADRVERAFTDLKDRYGSTSFAQQGALLAAKALHDKGKADAAKSALTWVAGQSADEGYKAVAKLRLAGLLADAKAYDEALAQLASGFPASFAGLVADRKGDILMLQGKKAEARDEYKKAYDAMGERAEYRRLVEVKLNSLGVDPKPAAPVKAEAKS